MKPNFNRNYRDTDCVCVIEQGGADSPSLTNPPSRAPDLDLCLSKMFTTPDTCAFPGGSGGQLLLL